MTAAWLHGLDVPAPSRTEVTIPPNVRRSRAQVHVTGAPLEPCDIWVKPRNGVQLPVTSPLRTAFDLARSLPCDDAVVNLDELFHRRLAKLAALVRYIAAHRGWRGVAAARQVAELVEPRTRSRMESRFRLLMIRAALAPAPGVVLRDGSGDFIAEADYLLAPRLVVEYDGLNHRERLIDDDRRQNRLSANGYTVLRFTYPDIVETPDRTVDLIKQTQSSLAGGLLRL
jgi:hypothetical protein